ncbi:coiled-coil domain-containing 110 [Pelobates cultripes]|uniref:Coiled-coil domain-containing 110 n=1 Tax=Pelobates cultripes TaxID=61616 RepID=A0AAD1WDT4_PELCU|nr:coiled-coil domain-containing 110 [Pelobates cultripes]
MCRGCWTCPPESTVYRIDDENQCCLNDFSTITEEEKQSMHLQKYQSKMENLEHLKGFQAGAIAEFKASNTDHTLNVQEFYNSKPLEVQTQSFRDQNQLYSNILKQPWLPTRYLSEENTHCLKDMDRLEEEKNIIQLQLTQAEEDGKYYIKEMDKVINKCEEFLNQRKHIEDERNLLRAERQLLMKTLHEREIEKDLLANNNDKDRTTELLKTTRQHLLSHIEDKQQLQLKLGRALMENILLKEQLTQTQSQTKGMQMNDSDQKEFCLELASFNNHTLNLESVAQKTLNFSRVSYSDQYKSNSSNEQLLCEIKDLRAKNMMLWSSYCEKEQQYQHKVKQVNDLKHENNLLKVELGEQLKTTLQLQDRIRILNEEALLRESSIATLEHQIRAFKYKLCNLQEKFHFYSEHIGNKKIIEIQKMLKEERLKSYAIYKHGVSGHISVNYSSSLAALQTCTENNGEHSEVKSISPERIMSSS